MEKFCSLATSDESTHTDTRVGWLSFIRLKINFHEYLLNSSSMYGMPHAYLQDRRICDIMGENRKGLNHETSLLRMWSTFGVASAIGWQINRNDVGRNRSGCDF